MKFALIILVQFNTEFFKCIKTNLNLWQLNVVAKQQDMQQHKDLWLQ